MIEQTSYWAAHAACHATMNGISRTIALDTDIQSAESLQKNITQIFNEDPFDALVIPGLTDPELQKIACNACQPFASQFDFRVFLDPPKTSSLETIVKRQKECPPFAAYAWPWVSTITPGRRSMELLPPSCLIAPLALGTTTFLKGVHDEIHSEDNDYLDENHVEVLCMKKQGPRRVIGRFREAEKRIPKSDEINTFIEIPNLKIDSQNAPDRDENAIEADIRRQLDRRCTDVIQQYGKNDRTLWAILERTATSILLDAKQHGKILNFHVRCDEETASWGTPSTPVLEIILEYPKRVKSTHFLFK